MFDIDLLQGKRNSASGIGFFNDLFDFYLSNEEFSHRYLEFISRRKGIEFDGYKFKLLDSIISNDLIEHLLQKNAEFLIDNNYDWIVIFYMYFSLKNGQNLNYKIVLDEFCSFESQNKQRNYEFILSQSRDPVFSLLCFIIYKQNIYFGNMLSLLEPRNAFQCIQRIRNSNIDGKIMDDPNINFVIDELIKCYKQNYPSWVQGANELINEGISRSIVVKYIKLFVSLDLSSCLENDSTLNPEKSHYNEIIKCLYLAKAECFEESLGSGEKNPYRLQEIYKNIIINYINCEKKIEAKGFIIKYFELVVKIGKGHELLYDWLKDIQDKDVDIKVLKLFAQISNGDLESCNLSTIKELQKWRDFASRRLVATSLFRRNVQNQDLLDIDALPKDEVYSLLNK